MSDQRYIKEGWLMKRSRSGKLMANWRRRYFRLSRTELVYFKTPQDTAPRRRYELTLDSTVLRTNDHGYTLCISFQPAPGKPSFFMQAENEVEKEEWIAAIYNAYQRTSDVAQQTPAAKDLVTQPPPQPAPPSRILLKLVVEEARNLKAADMNGKSDPYCVVKLVGKDGKIIDIEEKRTDVIPVTLEPAWHASFEIGRVVDMNTVKAVRFDLWDHDAFKRHDSLGFVQVPFSRFRMSPGSTAQSEPIDEWFRVEPSKKTGSSPPRRKDSQEKEDIAMDWGELCVRMSISGPNLHDFFHSSELGFVPTSPVATVSIEHTDNRLEVAVIAAKNLISGDLNDSSDPYCELTLLDDHGRPIPGEYATTATMHSTRNPAWANEHHVFGLICHIETAASLKVRVIDYDRSDRHDPLGYVIIGLDQLSAHKWTEWHTLLPEEGMSTSENLGEIQLQIWLIGERRGEHARRQKIDKELNLKAHNESIEQRDYENAQFELHDAACKLDGARIPCAVTDYQARDPRFYGINGCIHYLNTQIPRAHQDKMSTDEVFQARAGLEGQALLEVTVMQASELKQNQKQVGDTKSTAIPYAVIEIDPTVCIEECKRTSAPLSPQKSKRIAAAASEARNAMFSKRAPAEVSLHRKKLVKNEVRSEKSLEMNPGIPALKVEILTGHGLSPADMNGYSDPYCTLSITDRTTGKEIEAEKKRTAVVSKTLNPVWANENFVFGNNTSLSEVSSLLIHVKDHNKIGKSTPLGRVEISLYDLCRASADVTSINSRQVEKRYELKPEPWMKTHAKDLGELCIKTEVVGDATALAELMLRVSTVSFSEANIQSEASMNTSMSAIEDLDETELEDETTEVLQRGAAIRTSTSRVLSASDNTATWGKEKFSLSLSYPGIFSDVKYPSRETQLLQLRIHQARNLLISGDRINLGSKASNLDLAVGDPAPTRKYQLQNGASVYFTVIPVRRDGTLEDAERVQSLTVYNARDPTWPVQTFVFGKIKDISNVSYLSLHLYERDLENDLETVLANLLTEKEKKLEVCLKRFQLHKLSPAGEVEDDDFELLQFGQRVLAFRGGEDGGRFYRARIERYFPYPRDEYEVRFNDEIETIDDFRNLISLDVKGVVQAERGDGQLDVMVENDVSTNANPGRSSSRHAVEPTQLVPVNSSTENIEKLMARRLDIVNEETMRRARMQHHITGIVIEIFSASDLQVLLSEEGKPPTLKQLDKDSYPSCRVTLLGKPMHKEESICYCNDQGELFTREAMPKSTWKWETNQSLEAIISAQVDAAADTAAPGPKKAADHAPPDNKSGDGKMATAASSHTWMFQKQSLVIGRVSEYDYEAIDPDEAKVGYQILGQTSSIFIQIDAKIKEKAKTDDKTDVSGKKKSKKKDIQVQDAEYLEETIGYVKVDLAMLRTGQQYKYLQIIPPSSSKLPFYKSAGSLFVRFTTISDDQTLKPGESFTKPEELEQPRLFDLSTWFQKQRQLEAQSSTLYTRGVTWIERRQILRSSLSPTQNAQIDALHTVLVIIMKRIVSILREIRQFEEFEKLSRDEMMKCGLVHTVNAVLGSQYLDRAMDTLSHEVRRGIVVGLENELLDLAGVPGPRVFPADDIAREEWLRFRTTRQKLLQENGSFFMRDQTSVLILLVPKSFTGEGIISWFRRQPAVLWDDKWDAYCNDDAILSSCRLGWRNQDLDFDRDALQAPASDSHALQWMSALCAAGFVENVTPGLTALDDFGQRHVLMENRDDRFYRLHEVDMWMEKQSREQSLFPLDIVREIDCNRKKTGNSSNKQTPQINARRGNTYAKELTEHCDGFLGMHTMLSKIVFTVKGWKNSLVSPTKEKAVDSAATEKSVKNYGENPVEAQGRADLVENILWNWRYCLFDPARKRLYMYEKETSMAPMAFIDMASAVCKIAYNFSNDSKGGWMDIINPVVCVKKPDSNDFVLVTPETLDKMTKTQKGDKVIEVKTPSTQKWIQALARAGVRVDMRPGQEVLMKQLNPVILQQKCNKHATEFDPNDLEGSFHRLLNRLFGHDRGLTHQDHEKERRELRAQVRSELKKAGAQGEAVMAYYGKGKNLKSELGSSVNFKKYSLYAGRIIRIRTPFIEEKYPFTATYDPTDTTEVPRDLKQLLEKYKVDNKASWLSLPKSQRDIFLLYDVEYSLGDERIVEEGLMREHIRTNEGDLDPQKVRDKCADLNILFKATDLENCVSRMVKHRYSHKPLGVLKIHTKMISPYRTLDAWYPLAPASDMLQKTNIGQLRVELKIVQKREVKRSTKFAPISEAIKQEAAAPQLQQNKPHRPTAKDASEKLQFVVGKEPSFVKISILEGRGLPVADFFSSDPFVEIILLDNSSKEVATRLKTDIKSNTLNPKWENQEFLLGKVETTKLSDKKAVLLRVMDHDKTSVNDPLGYVTIEFQRSEAGYIRSVILKQADAYGNATTQELKMNSENQVEVEAMLLPVSGKPNPKTKPAPNGVLGKLRFVVEILRNENFVNPNLNAKQQLETTHSAEIAIKSAVKSTQPAEDWSTYTCSFQPRGEGGMKVKSDPALEDLGSKNPYKFSELLSAASGLMRAEKAGRLSEATSFKKGGVFKVLGRTYDLSKVDYFDVYLFSDATGKSYEGQLGKSDRTSERKTDDKVETKPKFSLKTPMQCANFRDETIILSTRDSKDTVTLTFDLNLVGILRADRVKSLLADTFRLVGLSFDSRTFNHSSGRYNPEQLHRDVDAFLWENCQSNFSGRNVTEELLTQMRTMSQASKLHWKITPKLLGYVFELVFLSGDNDRLSYVDTVALDAILNRWSRVLTHVAEAKDYLTGNFHGKKTPLLIETLFTECEWTGFNFSLLSGESSSGNISVSPSSTIPTAQELSSLFSMDDRVTVKVPFLRHVGVAVDVQLLNGGFAGGTIVKECGGGRFNVKLRPIADETNTAGEENQVRLAKLKEYDSVKHPTNPYLVEYVDNLEPREEWKTQRAISAMLLQIDGMILKAQLENEDYVQISEVVVASEDSTRRLSILDGSQSDNNKTNSSFISSGRMRPGKITRCYGDARYDVVYIDGQLPPADSAVNRLRLVPVFPEAMYDGKVSAIYAPAGAGPPEIKYSVCLENGEMINNLARNQIRACQGFSATDTALLGAIFSSSLPGFAKTMERASRAVSNMATTLNKLWWGGDKIVKVYAILPAAVKSVTVRNATTKKLMETALLEWNNDQPRFLGQYHGFVKGETLNDTEEEQLKLIHAAVSKRRKHSGSSHMIAPFSKKNCFYLLVSPPSVVRVRGLLRVCSSSLSAALFKGLVLATMTKTTGSIVPLVRQLLRAECNTQLESCSKACRVAIECVKVEFAKTHARNTVFYPTRPSTNDLLPDDTNALLKDLAAVSWLDASIDIVFELTVPYNDQDNIIEAAASAYEHAAAISKRLQTINTLAVEGGVQLSDPIAVDKMSWVMAPFESTLNPRRTLSIGFSSQAGRLDLKPEVSLASLEDIRVSVCDSDNTIHDLHFRIDDILAEAKVRSKLAPFHKAVVVSPPSGSKGPSSMRCGVQFVSGTMRKSDEMPVDKTTAAARPKTNSSKTAGETVTSKTSGDTSVNVPTGNIKFDNLYVKVFEASNMTFKEKTLGEDLQVEVLLISSDFKKHMTTSKDKKIATPFGLEVSSVGEILPNLYPKNSTFLLAYDSATAQATKLPSVAWKVSKKGLSHVVFKYPEIDFDRVSEVILIVRDKKTKIGTVTIPMEKIAVAESVNRTDKRKDEPIYNLQQDGSDWKRVVVGTLSLCIERIQKYGAGAEVYAKQLEKSVDFWTISPTELLKMTLEHHENKLSRSFLAIGPLVLGEGKVLLKEPDDLELQLQKITKVQIFAAATKAQPSHSVSVLSSASKTGKMSSLDLTTRALDQLQLTLKQTKLIVKDAAVELGLGHYVIDRRLPWSFDPHADENESQRRDDVVIVEANVATCTFRMQRTVLKLHEVLATHFIPTLDELYDLDAQGEDVDIVKGEKLLSFFDTEVEELEPEDQKVRLRLYQRLRLTKLIQVLDMIMRASVRVNVMDEGRNNVGVYLGTACIPLMDLLDQQPRDDVYELLYLPTTNLASARNTVQVPGQNGRGKLRLRLHLKVSESSFFEEAISVYKNWKERYIAQHEAARRRIHDTVVPAQRRRWMTIKLYLDELMMQADGKLHWERTPVLLNLVWDIFALHETSPTHSKKKLTNADEAEYAQKLDGMASDYREAVMKVHKRWVNLQPELDEVLAIQAASKIDATRTPQVLDDIEREIEGLDVGLSTAWKQVKQKWLKLLDVLEELVRMQERKLSLTRAPQLLNIAEQRCSKGLNPRHSKAVSQTQARWIAITQENGPLSELQLMDKTSLHWRRTHELLLLLDEQCEDFAPVDAAALETVQNRWEQVQEWLNEVVEMQLQYSIDCEHTPLILEKMHLWKPSRLRRQEELTKLERSSSLSGVGPSSPKGKDDAASRQRGISRMASEECFRSENGAKDIDQLEGMEEWYAIEEAKYELERIPYHRITGGAEKKNWLLYSRDGQDTRLTITQEEMLFTPANVRLALEDRGVIPKTSLFDPTGDVPYNANAKDEAWVQPSLLDSKSGSQSVVLPKHIDEEIQQFEEILETHRDNNQRSFSLANPERVAELYQAMESLGKTDLLWIVNNAVSVNRELVVPENYHELLREMTIRQIQTTEVEDLVKSLAFALQKDELVAKGITATDMANPTTLLQLMNRYQIKEVALPQDIHTIQTLLEERGMDRKGEPVLLRGVRIGTQSRTSTINQTSNAAPLAKTLNTRLGIIDTQIEVLRETLLYEALRKRNSLVHTFAIKSHVLAEESERTEADMFAATVENAEIDLKDDYLTLVERFQRLLVHESYTKRLAAYAAQDRCMRALLGKSRDEVVTKEDIAMELFNVNKRVVGANYGLPPEAFTREELQQAVAVGRIRTPSEAMLSRCPKGKNASAMAHYAAISYAANVFQEVTSFRSRIDRATNQLQDTFLYDECSSLDGVSLPKQRQRWKFSHSISDWLLGFDGSKLGFKRKLSAAHRQRLEWASAAFTLRNRWLQRGIGWCDHQFGEGVGVKILLDRLLLFEAANKMDMVKTEKLLREVRDKCSKLRDREQEAQAKLEGRYQENLELLEKLVTHAERCMNNRKLHSEETPVLLHKLEQVCVVPKGLNDRHREAYHTVATHWLPHQQHLTELVKMHREGTFSITRTPELLGKMQYHTEGKAGAEELSEEKVAASAQRVAPELQATFVDRKLNEVRLGQRKEPSSLRLDLGVEEDIATQTVDDTAWKELSHSKREVQPLSPHEKHTKWNVVKNAVAANAAFSAASPSKSKAEMVKIEPKTLPLSPRRKLSLSDELKELLRSPSQWLAGSGPQEISIAPEIYFPKELVLETTSESKPLAK
ncbi:hypothetical protein V7S43_014977 [Phytophthora oleae]|uniref:Calmodulin n=1 Tax=Phytophthora oleae TaxID=2107226 RepID=A0ABD3F3S1_9STRA